MNKKDKQVLAVFAKVNEWYGSFKDNFLTNCLACDTEGVPLPGGAAEWDTWDKLCIRGAILRAMFELGIHDNPRAEDFDDLPYVNHLVVYLRDNYQKGAHPCHRLARYNNKYGSLAIKDLLRMEINRLEAVN